MVDYIENSNSRKLRSDSPPPCLFSEITSKEESDLKLELEEKHEQKDDQHSDV